MGCTGCCRLSGNPCWWWTVPEISVSKGPAGDQSQPAGNAAAVCELASQPSLAAYKNHAIDVLRSESFVRPPMKNQLTHHCLTHLIHPEMPPILLNCHQECPGLQELVRNHVSCREWVGTVGSPFSRSSH